MTNWKINALVAKHVMGLKVTHPEITQPEDWEDKHFFLAICNDDDMPTDSCPRYSTDIAAAWDVIEKFRAEGKSWGLVSRSHEDKWECSNVDIDGIPLPGWGWENSVYSTELTAPLAICLSALKAKGVDIDSI